MNSNSPSEDGLSSVLSKYDLLDLSEQNNIIDEDVAFLLERTLFINPTDICLVLHRLYSNTIKYNNGFWFVYDEINNLWKKIQFDSTVKTSNPIYLKCKKDLLHHYTNLIKQYIIKITYLNNHNSDQLIINDISNKLNQCGKICVELTSDSKLLSDILHLSSNIFNDDDFSKIDFNGNLIRFKNEILIVDQNIIRPQTINDLCLLQTNIPFSDLKSIDLSLLPFSLNDSITNSISQLISDFSVPITNNLYIIQSSNIDYSTDIGKNDYSDFYNKIYDWLFHLFGTYIIKLPCRILRKKSFIMFPQYQQHRFSLFEYDGTSNGYNCDIVNSMMPINRSSPDKTKTLPIIVLPKSDIKWIHFGEQKFNIITISLDHLS
jgi:hypothetical protein